jgi:hypothetical protein
VTSSDELTAADADVYHGDQQAVLTNGWFEDEQGGHTDNTPTGSRCTFAARVHFYEALTDPVFGVAFSDSQGRVVWAASTEREPTGSFEAGSDATFRITFDNLLAPDRYFVSPWLGRQQGGEHVYDRQRDWTSIVVHGQMASSGGVVDLPHSTSVARGEAAPSEVLG